MKMSPLMELSRVVFRMVSFGLQLSMKVKQSKHVGT